MAKSNHLIKFKNRWLVLVALFLLVGFLRHSTIVEKTWINIGLLQFNKIHQTLLFEQNVFTVKVVRVESLLRQITQEKVFDSKNNSAKQALALILITQNRQNEALQILHKADTNPVSLIVSQAMYASSISLNVQAINWYYKAVDLEPNRANVWYEIGLLHQLANQTDKSIISFQQSWSLLHASSAHPLAELLQRGKNCAEAVDIWQTALDIFQDHPHRLSWWRGLSNCLRTEEQWADFTIVTENAIKEFSDDARLYVEIGYARYYGYEDLNGALESFHHAIMLDDELAIAYAGIANIFFDKKDYENALIWYRKAISKDSNNRTWIISYAISARTLGQLELSLQLLQELVEQYPDWAYAHYQLAFTYYQNGKGDKAILAIEQALSLLASPNPHYFVRAGFLFESQGNINRAIYYFEQALMFDPQNEVARQGIIRLKED